MGGLCGGASRADRRERERSAERAVDVGKVERRTGVSAIASDFLKDVGLQKPDTEYYSRMRERREAAQTEQARLREKRSRDRRRERAATATTDTTTESVTPVTPTAPTTPTQPTAPTTPTPPPAPPPFTETVDTGADTTYKGGDVSVGDVIDNRVVTSETEADAIESTGKGRRATIATSPRGLLGTGTAGTVRRRRSLMGGGLIR